MNLAPLQQHWQTLIIGQQADALLPYVEGPTGVDTLTALSAYQNNHQQNCRSALGQTFPKTLEQVGEHCFNQLCQRYLHQFPIAGKNLDQHGKDFAEFLNSIYGMQQHTPYLPDLARLEYALHCSYFAANRNPFDFSAFTQAFSQHRNNTYFSLADDVFLVGSPFPLHRIFELPDRATKASHNQYHYLVERPRYQPLIQQLSAELFFLLAQIQQKTPVNELAVASATIDTLTEESVINGWIGGFYVSG